MSKPVTEHPPRRGADDADPPVSAEEERIIRERLATFEQDRKAARPAGEVLERLLRRHPAS